MIDSSGYRSTGYPHGLLRLKLNSTRFAFVHEIDHIDHSDNHICTFSLCLLLNSIQQFMRLDDQYNGRGVTSLSVGTLRSIEFISKPFPLIGSPLQASYIRFGPPSMAVYYRQCVKNSHFHSIFISAYHRPP